MASQLVNYLYLLLPGLLVALILLPLVKWIIWKLFAFDKRVNTILAQKKSSEVRLGKISETLSPLLEDFPVDVHKPGTSTVFIGQPIDFIHFDSDQGITFIEVKSGNAKLTQTQRKLKDLVEAGHVNWVQFRVQ